MTWDNHNLRYVHDTVLVPDTKEGLQSLVTVAKSGKWKRWTKYEREENQDNGCLKTRRWQHQSDTCIQIDNETLEQVNTFKYLSQTIAPDDKNESEIKIKKSNCQKKKKFQRM